MTTPGPGVQLFRFVRFWSRRWHSMPGRDAEHARNVMVVEAVSASDPMRGATINEIARELGIDQSGASRMVSNAMARGYLEKSSGTDDGRHRRCRVTASGSDLLANAHAWQEQIFRSLAADWTDDEIRTFASMMERLLPAESSGIGETTG